jgi:hypothetical protein
MPPAALIFAVLSTFVAAGAVAAGAGDRGSWFESLKMPGTNASCCGAGDCNRTEADWRGGQWWAVVRGEWRPVPPSKVLASPASIDGAAYICTGSPAYTFNGFEPDSPIYCFVPPIWGM